MGASGSRPTVGWRILKIMPNSPCSQKGLVAYFDVLTHVNGVPLGTTEDQLVDLIKDGVETKLTIYHYVTDSVREVTVTPRRGWGGDGLLGLIIRYAHFDNADQDTIHVLEVHPNSPAAKAGLISHQDYLLGTSKLTFKGYDQLDYFLTQYNDKPGELFVFNAEQYQVREVIITPSTNWGGKGSLGCDVGAGYLHRLPLDTTRAVTQLGEGAMTPFISAGTAQQHGHAHAHAHAHAAHGDHGHSHGENDHGHSHGGNDCGHAHGPHDDHGHAHGPHDDHGHAHGVHDDHGHAHGDHGHSHGGNDHGHAHGDHGHSHGGNDHGHAHHGHAPAPVATPSTISYATPTQPTGVTTGAPGQYPPPPQQQQQQQPAQAQAQAQYQPQAQYSFAPPPNSFAGQPISSYSDSTTPGLFTQEVYGNQVTDPRLQAAFAGQPQYAAGQYVPATTTPAAAAAAGATPAPAPTTAAGLSVQAPFNTQYPPQQFAGASSYPAHPHPAYLQQAPNQQPYIIQPANVPPMQSQVKLEPSASSLP